MVVKTVKAYLSRGSRSSTNQLSESQQHLVREALAVAQGELKNVEPRRMSREQLVEAAWGYLGVEEKELTIAQVRATLG